ncbi:MAG: glycosyltransferase family 4 protein [Nocardioides sp.]
MSSPLSICLIASARFPVGEPFAGGLEAHTHMLAAELIRRGHRVTLFAGPGSDAALGVTELPVSTFRVSSPDHGMLGAAPDEWMREHHAYLGLLLDLAGSADTRFDVVHNNSLHYLPVAMAGSLPVPMVTTLHTPPLPWLESAVAVSPASCTFVAVSDFTASSWATVTRAETILNGVDTDWWRPGPGGAEAVWSGRIVPEKAPHLAVEAARLAGVPIRLAGPVLDRAYFDREVAGLLGEDATYLGHLAKAALRDLVGTARVALVTPDWDEPYGLVAAEAMSCGTPVAAFARGALPEIIGATSGRLAPPGDVEALASALGEAARLDRREVRGVALEHFSMSRMVDEYESLYRVLSGSGAAA